MKQRITALVLSFLMVFGMVPVSAFTAFASGTPSAASVAPAATAAPTDIIATYDWYDAEATIYEIDSVSDLAGLAKLTQGAVDGVTSAATNFAGKTVKLVANLNTAGSNWVYKNVTGKNVDGNYSVGVDYRITGFAGTFDGTGHTIYNLSFVNETSVTNGYTMGLFKSIAASGSVVNLTVDTVNAALKGGDKIAGIAYSIEGTAENCHVKNMTVTSDGQLTAYGFGSVSGESASASKCTVEGINFTTTYEGSTALQGGGFGGASNSASITDCHAKNVTAICYGEMKFSGFGYVGSGVCSDSTAENIKLVIKGPEGWSKDTCGFGGTGGTGLMEDCHIKNVQIVNEAPWVLRMVGAFASTSHGTFKNCTVTDATITAVSTQQNGGFIGEAQKGSTFENCRVNNITFNLGDASNPKAHKSNAGFIGQANGSNNDTRITVNNCHVINLKMKLIGELNGDTNAGFIGQLGSSVDISDCSVTGYIDASGILSEYSSYPVGGFVGNYGWGSGGQNTFTDCVANVDIIATGAAGGFVGMSKPQDDTAAHNSTFTNCVANGDVVSTDGVAGGFVAIGNRGTFENCVANGNVKGTVAAGFWGTLTYNKASINVAITGSKANGQVIGTDIASGFVGTIATADEENANATPVSITNSKAASVVAGAAESFAFAKDITPATSTSVYTASGNTDGALNAEATTAPSYNLGRTYLSWKDSTNTNLQIWGEVVGDTAINTFVVNFYDKLGNKVASTTLNQPVGNTISWHIRVTGAEDPDWWSYEWVGGEPTPANAPAYAEFIINGTNYGNTSVEYYHETYPTEANWADYFVATVDGVYYFTLQSAIDAASESGKTVVMQADETVNAADGQPATHAWVKAGRSVTIDMNGKTLNGAFYIDGTATIMNGTIINRNLVSGIETTGNLTLDNMVITSDRHAIRVAGGNVTVNGGIYTTIANGSSCYAMNIKSDDETVVTVNGGEFYGSPTASVTGNSAITVQKSNNTLIINDGMFYSGANAGLAYSVENYSASSEIHGGKFRGTLVNGYKNIDGGIFSTDPNAQAVEGYKAYQMTNGLWKVHELETIPSVDERCTTDGATEGIKCARCDEVLEAPVVIPALGHDFANGVYTNPTFDADGYWTCTRCDATDVNEGTKLPVVAEIDGNRYADMAEAVEDAKKDNSVIALPEAEGALTIDNVIIGAAVKVTVDDITVTFDKNSVVNGSTLEVVELGNGEYAIELTRGGAAVTGFNATVTIPAVDSIGGAVKVYYLGAQNEKVYLDGVYTVVNGTATFTTDHFSTWGTEASSSEREFAVSADKTNVAVGEEVTVTVTLNGTDLVGATWTLDYDETKFELVSGAIDGEKIAGERVTFDESEGLATYIFKAKVMTPDGIASEFTVINGDAWNIREATKGNSVVEPIITPVNVTAVEPDYEVSVGSGDYVAGKKLVLVYTNSEVISFNYAGATMYDATAKYAKEGYAYTYAIVTDAITGDYSENISVVYSKTAPEYVLVYDSENFNYDLNASGDFTLRDVTVAFGVFNVEASIFAEYMNIVLNADTNADGTVNGIDTKAFADAYQNLDAN